MPGTARRAATGPRTWRRRSPAWRRWPPATRSCATAAGPGARREGPAPTPKRARAAHKPGWCWSARTARAGWRPARRSRRNWWPRSTRCPSENQWYAEPPAPPLGTGSQLLVLSATAPDRRLEASLASDGRWWCHLSVTGPRGSEQKLPPPAQAGARRRAGAPGAHPGGGPPTGQGGQRHTRRQAAVRGIGRSGLARSAARGPAPALAEPPRHPALRHRDGSTVPRLHAGPALG